MRLPSVERESSELPVAPAESVSLDQAQEELDGLRRALAEGEVHHMPAPALARALGGWALAGFASPWNRTDDFAPLLFRCNP